MFSSFISFLPLISLAVAVPTHPSSSSTASLPISSQTTCNGKTYTYNELAGYGYIPSRARDKYGDTLGGFGSSIAIDQTTWKKTSSNTYTGIMWAVPDRGWNTEGTLNYQNRIHKIAITLTLNESATAADPSPPNLNLKYEDTILLTGPDFNPTTGLDPAVTGPYLKYPSYPELPSIKYTGDGFGGNGTGGNRISIDSEGLVLGADGTFWVSDEYGPYIYQFSPSGRMIQAVRPPNAYIPTRNNTVSFSADSPPIYNLDEVIIPADTTSGRDNNQGLEGLTISTDGTRLYSLMQSALDQEGGPNNPYRRQARLLVYDISTPLHARYLHEYIVTLPLTPSGTKVAAQSEIHYISPTQILILARDSGNGRGQGDANTTDNSNSKYRHIDIFDLSNATDIKSPLHDDSSFNSSSIASPTGVLLPGLVPATYCPWLDFNNNSALARFGLHNGGLQNATLLNEKWESIALVPVHPSHSSSSHPFSPRLTKPKTPDPNPNPNPDSQKEESEKQGEFFLISLSDNDFITQDGYMDFGRYPYRDSSGFDLDNQALVFRVELPFSSASSS